MGGGFLERFSSNFPISRFPESARGSPNWPASKTLRMTRTGKGAANADAFRATPRSQETNWEVRPTNLAHGVDSAARRTAGATGRTFAGRVLQLITGSTGLDDYEWGVTLFAVHPDDLKDVVYTMRFDEASATYAEFGQFYIGMVETAETVLDEVGLR